MDHKIRNSLVATEIGEILKKEGDKKRRLIKDYIWHPY